MIEHLMEKIEWPGRPVRATAKQSADATSRGDGLSQQQGGEEEEEAQASSPGSIPPLIDPQNGPSVRQSLDAAELALQQFESTVDDMLDETVSVDTSEMPQTNAAARMINGTHPAYGDDFPDIDDKDKTGDGSGHINADTFRMAHEILERPDQNVLGIDAEEAVLESGPSDTIRPYQPVKTPREAAGRDPVGRRDPVQLPEAFEKKEKEKKLSLWKRAALPMSSIAVRFAGDMIHKVGDIIKNMFSISIPLPGPNFTISLSRPIAIGFYMIADVLYDLADYLMDKALGVDPTKRPPNDQRPPNPRYDEQHSAPNEDIQRADDREGDDDTFDKPLTKQQIKEEISYPAAVQETPESAGERLTEAAFKVVDATMQEANNRTDPSLATALRAYDQAKQTRIALRRTNQFATSVGVPSTTPDQQDPQDQPLPGTTRTPPTPVATEQSPFEEC